MAKGNITVRLLDTLGERGMTYTEIQREIYRLQHWRRFYNWKEIDTKNLWTLHLTKPPHCRDGIGILNLFCEKGEDGRWYRNNVPHLGHPWRVKRLYERGMSELCMALHEMVR